MRESITLRALQEEQAAWAKKNFPNQVAWHTLLGVCEELGELCNARMRQDWADEKDSVADLVIFLAGYCTASGESLEAIAVLGEHHNSARRSTLTADSVLLHLTSYVGKLCHAHLKGLQGIRHAPDEIANLKRDAIDGIMETVQVYCAKSGINFVATLTQTWEKVSQRDWTKNAVAGVTA